MEKQIENILIKVDEGTMPVQEGLSELLRLFNVSLAKRKVCADELTPNSCRKYNLRRGCHNCERYIEQT
jgi:hypothetical protein